MNNMNIELAVILKAIRDNAIALGVCLKFNNRLNVSSCYRIECISCPLYQGIHGGIYFDNWASVASPLTIEVNYEQGTSTNTIEY